MRNWLALVICLFGLAGAQTTFAAEAVTKKVYIIPIREEISPALVYVVRRGVKEAMEAKADMIVLDMNTPGGRIDSMLQIINSLEKFKGQTVTYVNTWAFSAGALISLSTQKIYMAPLSQIGAAAPVSGTTTGGTESMPETTELKAAEAVSAMLRDRARTNGYREELVDAMVLKGSEFKIGDVVIKKPGRLLTLTTTEAQKEYGDPPKPLISSGTVDSIDDLLKKLGYEGAQRKLVKATGMEKLGTWIIAIGPLLLAIGIIGIYIEINHPGVVLPGVVAAIAFIIYFFGGYIAGLSGMEWVLVFVIGLALVISEFFVHPGVILPGIIGIILILISLVMAMVDIYPGMPSMPTLPQIRLPIQNLVIAMGGSLVVMAILARILPKTPLYGALVSTTASGVTSIEAQKQQQSSRVGQQGVAISNLRPGGKAQFGNEILDVITQGDMVPKGKVVRIIGHSGAEAIVETVEA